MKESMPKVDFHHFLEKFPEVELPVTLGEHTHHVFSTHNDALPELMVHQHIQRLEPHLADEYTEFVPCFRIAGIKDFHAIVYWKAGLMNYQYVLATLTKKGELIDRRVIAGTFSDGKVITRSVATIDVDWGIYIMSGQVEGSSEGYDPDASRALELELFPDGRIG